MSIFEQLRPFVSLCQACGMIPYTIEDNLITNTFSRFTFSFRNFTTWWFFLLFVMDIVVMAMVEYFTVSQSFDLLRAQNVPITVTILLLVTGISYFVQIFLSRWIVLYHHRLRKAIEAIQEVEKLFGEKFINAQSKNSITKRFVIGFILVVTWVGLKHLLNSFVFGLYYISVLSFRPQVIWL